MKICEKQSCEESDVKKIGDNKLKMQSKNIFIKSNHEVQK